MTTTKRSIDECRSALKKLAWPREYRERGKVEIRAGGEGRTIDMFVPFGSESLDMGFREIIEPGAMSRSIGKGRVSRRDDIFALFSHDASQPLARQANDTLMVTERDDGVVASATLVPEIDYHQRTLQLVKANLIRGTSFGFEVMRDDWEYDEEGNATRHLEEIRVFEFSPVVFPAYQESEAEARSALAHVKASLGADATELLAILREVKDGKVPLERRDALQSWITKLGGYVPEIRAAYDDSDYIRAKGDSRLKQFGVKLPAA